MLDFSVTFFITIINIAILFFVLRKILFRPVTKFMNERSDRIRSSIEQTDRDKVRAKELLEQYEARLGSAKAEAETIIKEARDTARQEADRIAAESRLTAIKTLQDAHQQIEAERSAALASFSADAAALVVAAAGRMLGRELNDDDNKKFALQLLNEAYFDSKVRSMG